MSTEGESASKGVCLLCFKTFDHVFSASIIIPYEARLISPTSTLGFASSSAPAPTSEGEDRLSASGGGDCHDIYTRFLHFSSRCLRLPTTTEVFLKAARSFKKEKGKCIQAFCGECEDLVAYVCDLYAEIQAIKLRIAWKLEKMQKVMEYAKTRTSNKLRRYLRGVLRQQLNVYTMTMVDVFRNKIMVKCKVKSKKTGLLPMAPRGLFPEHWKVGYPACKLLLTRLIVVFLLASSQITGEKISASQTLVPSTSLENGRRRRPGPSKSKTEVTIPKKQSTPQENVSETGSSTGSRVIVITVKTEHGDMGEVSVPDPVDDIYIVQQTNDTAASKPKRRRGRPRKIAVPPPPEVAEQVEDKGQDVQHVKAENSENAEAGTTDELGMIANAENLATDPLVNDNDSDWSRGAASPTSIGSVESPHDPTIKNVEEEATPTRRWNLRRVNRRPVVNFAESDSDSEVDSDQEDEKDADFKIESDKDKSDEEVDVDSDKSDKEVEEEEETVFDENNFVPAPMKRNSNRGTPTSGAPTLACPECGKMFHDNRCLSLHMRQKHDTHLNHSCIICGQKFQRWKEMRNHKRAMHRVLKGPKGWSKKPRKCLVCSKIFSTLADLSDHRRKANHKYNPRNPIQCPICQETLRNPSALYHHRRKHHPSQKTFQSTPSASKSKEKERKCPLCEKTFESASGLWLHRRRIHDCPVPRIKCRYCSEKFKSRPDLILHRRQKHKDQLKHKRRELQCNYCSETFESRAALMSHRRQEHAKPKSAPSVREREQCADCGKTFAQVQGLSRHRRICGKSEDQNDHDQKSSTAPLQEEVLDCPSCNKTFAKRATFLQHCRMKHGFKGFSVSGGRVPVRNAKCTECDEVFPTGKEMVLHRLKEHVLTVGNNEGGNKCPICDCSVSGRKQYQTHLKTHPGNVTKRFICEVCSRPFYSEETRQNHMTRVHHSNSQLCCSTCKVEFENDKLLRDHLAMHEKPEKFFLCMACFRGFTTKQYYSIHKKLVHGSKELSHCDYDMCNEMFENADEFNAHLDKHAETAREKGDLEFSEVFKCAKCDMRFLKKCHFVMHELTHIPKTPSGYPCPGGNCQFFQHQDQLLIHFNRVHGFKMKAWRCCICNHTSATRERHMNHMSVCMRSLKSDQYFCLGCCQQFPNSEGLINHNLKKHPNLKKEDGTFKTYTGESRHPKCPEPNCQVTGPPRLLNIHLQKVHGKGEQYPCDQCGKLFYDMRRLNQHSEIHTKPRFTCDICQRSFFKFAKLRAHKEIHEKDRVKEFTCHECGKSYLSETGLKFHSYSHANEDELPHKCQYCGKGYGRLAVMKMHQKACAKINRGVSKSDKDECATKYNKDGGQQTSQSAPYRQEQSQSASSAGYQEWLSGTSAEDANNYP